MDKNNKEVTKKEKTKVKRKRQTSIITIALWLFLIATMVTIVTSNVVNKEALEVEDNNWNITLVMYEDGGSDAKTDVTWNATSESDAKQVTMQINYACTTGKEYAPGEIEITVNGIAKDSFSEYWRSLSSYSSSYEGWLANNVVVAADKSTATTKQYDWSYSYDSTANTYTFTNNNTMVANEHFEGTIQLVYNLKPHFKIQTDLTFTAKMKENITADEVIAMPSNTCNFHYTSTKETYTFKKGAYTGGEAKGDFTKIEDILDDYYWVKYYFLVEANHDGTIYALDNNNKLIGGNKIGGEKKQCIKETLPEGCVIYDKDLNDITETLTREVAKYENGNVITDIKGNTCYNYYYLSSNSYDYFKSDYPYYYVGYPKSTYNEGDSITNTAELWRTI